MSVITLEEALGDVSMALDALRAMRNPPDEVAMAYFSLREAEHYLTKAVEYAVEANEARFLSMED